ncbi:hypothetical protein BLA24_08835 [Streptomyces cinnamoneus]|uniref:Uncharacterized protein n=1 Tax=Streptomyces cinnamoneus TaxID=53446 RepID=A0A2G1XLW1_STRCJ|nr:hypothetical protein BLA24_08835 [Streptomyces cinnamoneus]
MAVAMTAAVGCVSVSPSTGPSGPPPRSSAADPRARQNPARESLARVGDGPDDSRPPDASGPALSLTRDPDGRPLVDPSWDPWGAWAAGGSARNGGNPAGPPGFPGSPDRSHPGHHAPGSPRPAAPPAVSAPASDGPVREAAPAAPAPRHEAPPPPEHRHSEPRPAPEPREAPPAPAPVPRGRQGKGVCAMGDTYGKWQPGGDASRICHQVYGN